MWQYLRGSMLHVYFFQSLLFSKDCLFSNQVGECPKLNLHFYQSPAGRVSVLRSGISGLIWEILITIHCHRNTSKLSAFNKTQPPSLGGYMLRRFIFKTFKIISHWSLVFTILRGVTSQPPTSHPLEITTNCITCTFISRWMWNSKNNDNYYVYITSYIH